MICSIEGCDKECKRGTICFMHRSRWNRRQSYDDPRAKKTPKELKDKRNDTTRIRKQNYLEFHVKNGVISCSKCNVVKSIQEYYKHSIKHKSPWCIDCFRHHSRINDLKIKFGITLEQYNELLESQNHRCAICNEKENIIHHGTKEVIKLSVDHCHTTKKIRGLLCSRCNFGIGYFKDSIELLGNAIKYLEK